MTAEEVRIGGKYTVLRELRAQGNMTLSEVRGPQGEPLQLAWFDIDTPEQRKAFFAYRDALLSLKPEGLAELVARPDANYVVWRPLTGQTLEEFTALPARREDAVDSVRLQVDHLAEHGYALSDARVVLTGPALERAALAYLEPVPPRPVPDIRRLNAPLLRPLIEGRTRRAPNRGAWLAFVPGLLLLGGAAFYGQRALASYLNPAVGVVSDVTGRPANDAAKALTDAGFRVAYVDGEGDSAIGSVLRQEPEGDTNLPLGRLVTLTVNSPPDLTVPRVEDLTPERAKANLQESGFKLGKVTQVDGTATQTPEGRIISQDPPAGLSTQRGQSVNVLVSSGMSGKETWLPDLTGLDFTSAREHARAAGLVVTQVKEEASDLPENTVIAQSPKPFARVQSGEAVTLTVAAPKFSEPPATVSALPVPPPYVPPVQPPQPQPDPEPLPTPAVSAAEQVGSEQPGQPAQPPATAQPPVPEQTPPPQAPARREVALNYTFPADLPAGNYSIVVRDVAGQRQLMGATSSDQLAGALASSTVQVTGDAVFVVLRDGQVFATVAPQ